MPIDHIPLSALSDKIKEAISASFSNQHFWVTADITDHKYYPNHQRHYFNLVERRDNAVVAKIQATAGGDSSSAIANFEKVTGQHFTNGISVLISVSVSFHGVYGLQITLNDIDINYTIGQLARYKEQTIERLLSEEPDKITKKDGQLISFNMTRPLPIVLQNIALISSHNARGYEDFMDSISKNKRYFIKVKPRYTSVQGENNAQALVDSLKEIYNSGEQYDAVVIVRGGGSDTDFLIFDHYKVARAIARFPIPIIVGLGHATNQTVSDLVAHTSANTPTSAAEFIIKRNKEFEEGLSSLNDRIRLKVAERIGIEEKRLSTVKLSLSQGIGPIISKHRNLYERSRNVLIEHSTTIVAHNTNLIRDARGIIMNRPVGIITRNKSDVLEVHSQLTQRCNGILTKHKTAYERCRNIVIERSNAIVSRQSVLIRDARGVILNRPEGIITKNKTDLLEVQSLLTQRCNGILNTHKEAYGRCKYTLVDHTNAILSRHSGLIRDAKETIVNRPIGIIATNKNSLLELHLPLTQRCSDVLVGKWDEFRKTQTSIVNSTKHTLHHTRTELSDYIAKTTLVPRTVVRGNQANLNTVVERLKTNVTHNLQRKADSLKTEESLCRLMSPVNILRKGFAIVYSGDKVIRDGSNVNPSDNLRIRLSDTKIDVTVNNKTKTDGNEFDL